MRIVSANYVGNFLENLFGKYFENSIDSYFNNFFGNCFGNNFENSVDVSFENYYNNFFGNSLKNWFINSIEKCFEKSCCSFLWKILQILRQFGDSLGNSFWNPSEIALGKWVFFFEYSSKRSLRNYFQHFFGSYLSGYRVKTFSGYFFGSSWMNSSGTFNNPFVNSCENFFNSSRVLTQINTLSVHSNLFSSRSSFKYFS